jgi:hypothetical protein
MIIVQVTKTIAQISIFIFLYYIVYYTYLGLIHPIPALGDSWDYHIPISQSILDGSFLHPPTGKKVIIGRYFPGSSEAINSLLILLHIPLTLSNIFAVIVLFFVCFKLGLIFHLRYYFALLFASTIATLNLLVRWYNAVSIDIWIGVFFVLGIILLERPHKKTKYFLQLGFVLGMLIGSKYTGCYFVLLLIIMYYKNILSNINFRNIVVFFIPFSFFGLFWYIRNYIFMHNPFYPLPVAGFKGVNYYQDSIFKELIKNPYMIFNAVFGEYNIWLLLICIAICFFIYKKLSKKQIKVFGINRLFLIGIANLLLYLTFPTGHQPWIMVSSLRYSYPTFIPLILWVFLLMSYYKKEKLLGFISIANMPMVLSMAYYPKLTLIYIPLGFLVKYFFDKYEKRSINKKVYREP